MTAKRLVDNGKWVLWLAALIVGAIAVNRLDIVDLKVEAGKVETHIEYISKGVARLEEKFDTLPPPTAEK